MRKLVTAAALAAIVATPAFAQTARTFPVRPGAIATVPWDAVVVEGKVVGQDPDANVRLDLRRDAYGADHD